MPCGVQGARDLGPDARRSARDQGQPARQGGRECGLGHRGLRVV